MNKKYVNTIGMYILMILLFGAFLNPDVARASDGSLITADEKKHTIQIYYKDADTDEIIYSDLAERDDWYDVTKKLRFCLHEPPYIFQSENGEDYTLDAGNKWNRFLTGQWTGEDILVYYKKGLPTEGQTAAKVRMYDVEYTDGEPLEIGFCYVAGLTVGDSYQYEPELLYSGEGVFGEQLVNYIFEKGHMGNSLAIDVLNENVEENVIDVYYRSEPFRFAGVIGCDYYDSVTGRKIGRTTYPADIETKFLTIALEETFYAKDGTMYAFDLRIPGIF